ncbi:hypothetical protein GCM10009120_26730 [Sphingobacterium siyangense subsp. cladoniae]|uniref:hypothetical protein n=1 Tax=Sphingobacterium siyangense TaxID=459529 RepID=UPI0031F9DE03
MKVKTIGWYGVILVLFFSCQQNLKNSADLYSYVQDPAHGVMESRETHGIKVAMTYIPSKLMALDSHDSVRGRYLYFRLTYQIHNKDMLSSVDQNSYSVLFNRLSFKLAEYLSVSSGGKQEEIADFQFSPMFGATSSTEIVVAVDMAKFESEDEITLNLKDIGLSIPEYNFKFKKSSLDRLEELTKDLDPQR